MLHFSRWKMIAIFLVVALGALFAQPNLYPDRALQSFPDWLPSQKMNLGLDLQGGVHLQVKVEQEGLVEERLQTLESDLRASLSELRRSDAGVGYVGGLRARGRSVTFTLSDPSKADKVRAALETLTQPNTAAGSLFGSVVEVAASEPQSGTFTYSLTQEGIDNRVRAAVSQSIEVIRRRVDELGTNEPIIQRQGVDRIIVQVPGYNDPGRLKEIIGTTAKLTFREVAEDSDEIRRQGINVRDLLEQGAQAPYGTEILYTTDDPPQPILVYKRVKISGDSLVDAQPGFDGQTGEPIVSFRFDQKAARVFGDYTAKNIGRRFAIVLDEAIITAPVIRGAIPGGTGQISGDFTPDSANDLAVLMRAGALPAEITFVEERTVGPGLGQDSIDAGEIAAIVAALAVVAFMLGAYGTLGIIANIALAANLILIVGALSFLGATLTLPGIAGIVLTMGMAVDANVLIYERIREERQNGRSFMQSIDIGFRQALATIVDANLTTLIAAVILFYLGSGPIRGFAVTLAIGIITSVFTAFTLTRLLMTMWVRWKKPTELPRRWIALVPDETKLQFMRLAPRILPGIGADAHRLARALRDGEPELRHRLPRRLAARVSIEVGDRGLGRDAVAAGRPEPRRRAGAGVRRAQRGSHPRRVARCG